MTELQFYKNLDKKLWRIKNGALSIDEYIAEVAQKMIELSAPQKEMGEFPERKKEDATILYSPSGKKCYIRKMNKSDPNYLKGMDAVVDYETEEILMRHFDNVFYNALKKGYTNPRSAVSES